MSLTIALSDFTEYRDLDPLNPRNHTNPRDASTFVYPPFPPSLPSLPNDWPRGQSGLNLYVRPKFLPGTRPAPKEEVDDFLDSLGLPGVESSSTAGAGPSGSGLGSGSSAVVAEVQTDRSRGSSRDQSQTQTSRKDSLPVSRTQPQAGPSHSRHSTVEINSSQHERQTSTLSTVSVSTVAQVKVKTEPIDEHASSPSATLRERRPMSPKAEDVEPDTSRSQSGDVRVKSETHDSARSSFAPPSSRQPRVKQEADELQDDDVEMDEASNGGDDDAEENGSEDDGPHPWDFLDEKTRGESLFFSLPLHHRVLWLPYSDVSFLTLSRAPDLLEF